MPNQIQSRFLQWKILIIVSCFLGMALGVLFIYLAQRSATSATITEIAFETTDQPIEVSPEPTNEPINEPSVLGASDREQVQNRHKNNQLASRNKPSPTPSPSPSLSPAASPTPTIIPSPSPTPTASPSATPSPTLASQPNWEIESVSSMKESKDRICGQRSREWIEQWVDAAKDLGVNYVALETPYDDPICGSSLAYTRTWVEVIRSRGLKVWHRHMHLAFEGIYDVPKNAQIDYIELMAGYIRSNPELFEADDIFTPTPEPQNGGISGVTYCPENICLFTSKEHFNQWLRQAMTESEVAFSDVGLGGKMKVGYFGFDGFVAWGHNNPDWEGILEDETVAQMGNITIDHYPQLANDTMANSLDELEAKYPGVPIIIGEWGTITTDGSFSDQVATTMAAAKRPSVKGFNYWHMGVGGNEALINDDFSTNPHYATVQSFFTQ